jgi:hypothetical protein
MEGIPRYFTEELLGTSVETFNKDLDIRESGTSPVCKWIVPAAPISTRNHRKPDDNDTEVSLFRALSSNYSLHFHASANNNNLAAPELGKI